MLLAVAGAGVFVRQPDVLIDGDVLVVWAAIGVMVAGGLLVAWRSLDGLADWLDEQTRR